MKKMVLFIFGFLVASGLGIILFVNLSPAFGGKPTQEQKEVYKQFSNFVDGRFVNEASAERTGNPSANLAVASTSERRPSAKIPMSELDWNRIKSEEDNLTWLGHSAFLLSIDNKKMLIDPMLGSSASPVGFVKIKRFSDDLLHLIDQMPPIDAVFITHDHYDHLDYQSIVKLRDRVAHFFVPLGVSAHLLRWGVPAEKITELNWWQEVEYEGLTLVLTPAKHFSGRKLSTRNSTLWGGWVLIGQNTRLYTSGDGSYAAHFKEIGKKYGPFDITLIEGAQYDKRWPNSHMTPEQAVQANIDVNGKKMMLMHWGAFTLASHGWLDPIERALKEAKNKNVDLIVPKIGETVFLNPELDLMDLWWESMAAE
jgi:L-ascorbate metabolism protein UlaG (beta-lactamase superfamily)